MCTFVFQLDYIPRLMWQAQLRGNKSWSVAPTPECNSVCGKFTFYVEPGDAGKLFELYLFHVSNLAYISIYILSANGHSYLVSWDKGTERRVLPNHPVRVRLILSMFL